MVSEDLIRQKISREEGDKLKPYYDSKHILTIGKGWNMEANPLPGDIAAYLKANGQITQEMADRLLNIQINVALGQCRSLFLEFDTFSDNRQLALIDVVYNMGYRRISLSFPRFVHNVNIQDWEQAANELQFADGKLILSLYVKDVGNRAYENINLIMEG